MSGQTKRLSTREKQELAPLVAAAQSHDKLAAEKWDEIGKLLDKFGSSGHSQCCRVGGMRAGARNGFSGTSPCPCGWDAQESVEDVLRRMITFVGSRCLVAGCDQAAADLVTDALAALNRAARPC